MNYIQSKVMNWGIKLLTLVVLTVTMYSVANGQVEIEKLKNQAQETRGSRKKRRDKARSQIKKFTYTSYCRC